MTVRIRAYYRTARNQPVIEGYVEVEGGDETSPSLLESRTLAALRILYAQLDLPLTRRCAGRTAKNAPCTHYIDIASPYCGQHGPKRLPPTVLTATATTMSVAGAPMSVRALTHNVLYVTYARVYGMTVTQRWDADKKHTGPFDVWVAAMKEQFRRQRPAAISEDGTITDLTAWFAFLQNLRPETMRQRAFV